MKIEIKNETDCDSIILVPETIEDKKELAKLNPPYNIVRAGAPIKNLASIEICFYK